VDFEPFWRAWNIVQEKYVSTKPATTTEEALATDEEKVYGAIKGLLGSLDDPYTVFFPPEEAKAFQDDISGNFSGVGMEIGIRDNILTVVAPLKGTPASRAGIHSGDRILKIDERSTQDMAVDIAVRLIRGTKGTTVNLSILTDGADEPKLVKIVRDTIQIPTISFDAGPGDDGTEQQGLRKDGVFVFRLYNFSAQSPELFRSALQRFIETGSTKLILDLRGNPGGYLEAAVDMASWFLPKSAVVVSEHFGGTETPRVHYSRGYNIFNDNLKMVILVNQGSASASEILAGALQEHGVATLVGEKTFGKGSVQELIPVTGDAQMKLTVARWLTPNGTSLSAGGLNPDVVVEMTREDLEAGRDPQFDRAISLLTKGQ